MLAAVDEGWLQAQAQAQAKELGEASLVEESEPVLEKGVAQVMAERSSSVGVSKPMLMAAQPAVVRWQ